MNNMALAVVVIGRNEGDRLIACFESIRASHNLPEPAEFIYVDSNSTDTSVERAEALNWTVIVLGAGKQSAARARNAGWRASTAPLILFLDGDTILHPDFVHRAVREFDNPQVAVVWGNRRELRPEASIYNRILDLDWIYPAGFADFCGGDSLMRRSCLEQVNGFNPELIAGEEPDMCRRMRAFGHLILHVDLPMTLHDLAITRFKQYWRRAVRTGHAYAEISNRYRNTIDPSWSKEARANILRGTLYTLTGIAIGISSFILRSPLPILIGGAALTAMAVRTAVLCRWKKVSWFTLFLFGFHSHLQQVPILQGQILYLWGQWRRQNSELIEYKNGPS
jgi:cellulose synthase/poly-beta-1,6-N-acetylglucosamine synthase-like glycosyltransferase